MLLVSIENLDGVRVTKSRFRRVAKKCRIFAEGGSRSLSITLLSDLARIGTAKPDRGMLARLLSTAYGACAGWASGASAF
jgi:hypothetical protein